jgi:hypothetical protein
VPPRAPRAPPPPRGREGSSFDIARTEGDASPGRVCPMDAFI